MSKLSDLIKKYCPNGVEYKPLWSLTAWDKKFNGVDKSKQQKIISYNYYLAQDFNKVERKNGNIKYISTGISGDNRYTTEELAKDYLSEGEIVCIPWGGTPNVKYHKGKFVTGDNRIATSLDTKILNNKYLYYWLEANIKLLNSFYRGSGIKHPNMENVLNMNIPVPPLKIQDEIVKILDNFTELISKINTELSEGQKQYEYYRNRFFEPNKNTEYIPIKNLLQEKGYIRGPFGSALRKDDMVNIGIPIYEQQHAIYNHREFRYFITKKKAKSLERFKVRTGDLILSCSGTIGKTSIIKKEDDKGIINQALLILRVNSKIIDVDYLEYFLNSSFGKSKILSNSTGSAQMNICKREEFERIQIPVPSLNEQQRIVTILNQFNELYNDKVVGLPAELELRRKQYEYYRNKLLKFDEVITHE